MVDSASSWLHIHHNETLEQKDYIMTTNHTPTPWESDEDGNIVFTHPNGKKYVLATTHFVGSPIEQKQNTALIVKACNAHDDLVAALEDLIAYVERNGGPVPASANTALAKARGE